MYLKEHLMSKVHASTHSCRPHLLHLAPQPERPCHKMQPPPAVAQTITTMAYSLIKYLHTVHNVWGGQSMRFTVQDSAQHISHGDWIDVQIQDRQVSLAKLLILAMNWGSQATILCWSRVGWSSGQSSRIGSINFVWRPESISWTQHRGHFSKLWLHPLAHNYSLPQTTHTYIPVHGVIYSGCRHVNRSTTLICRMWVTSITANDSWTEHKFGGWW